MKQSRPPSAGTPKRKRASRAQVAQLAEEGLDSGEIAKKLTISRATVYRRLQRIRGGSAAKPLDPAEALRKKIEHYRSISCELLNAWRLSQADQEVRVVEETGPVDDPAAAKQKRSVRTVPRTGNATYLAKAMEAENRIEALEQRLAALEQNGAAGPGGGLARLADLTDDDLEKLTPDDLENFTDEQLFVIESRLRAKYGPTDLPLLTNEELDNMTSAQLAALELRFREEIERCRK